MLGEKKGILGIVRCEKMIDENTVSPFNLGYVANFTNYSLPILAEDMKKLTIPSLQEKKDLLFTRVHLRLGQVLIPS